MKVKKIVFPLIIIALVFLFLFSVKINNVECTVSDKECSETLVQNINKLKGTSLFLIDIQHELNSDQIQTDTYSYISHTKKFPDTLIIEFIEESILYEIEYDDKTYYVGEFGSILTSNQNNNNLTKIIWLQKNNLLIENLAINSNSHQKLSKLVKTGLKNDLNIREVVWEDFDKIYIYMPDLPMIIIDEEGINTKLESLVVIANSSEIKEFGEPISEIDLRFSLPVLRTRQ